VSIVPLDPCEPITPEISAELERRYPDAARIAAAMSLARDLATFRALYAGALIPAESLDQAALADARRRSLVQLRAPIELVNVREAAA